MMVRLFDIMILGAVLVALLPGRGYSMGLPGAANSWGTPPSFESMTIEVYDSLSSCQAGVGYNFTISATICGFPEQFFAPTFMPSFSGIPTIESIQPFVRLIAFPVDDRHFLLDSYIDTTFPFVETPESTPPTPPSELFDILLSGTEVVPACTNANILDLVGHSALPVSSPLPTFSHPYPSAKIVPMSAGGSNRCILDPSYEYLTSGTKRYFAVKGTPSFDKSSALPARIPLPYVHAVKFANSSECSRVEVAKPFDGSFVMRDIGFSSYKQATFSSGCHRSKSFMGVGGGKDMFLMQCKGGSSGVDVISFLNSEMVARFGSSSGVSEGDPWEDLWFGHLESSSYMVWGEEEWCYGHDGDTLPKFDTFESKDTFSKNVLFRTCSEDGWYIDGSCVELRIPELFIETLWQDFALYSGGGVIAFVVLVALIITFSGIAFNCGCIRSVVCCCCIPEEEQLRIKDEDENDDDDVTVKYLRDLETTDFVSVRPCFTGSTSLISFLWSQVRELYAFVIALFVLTVPVLSEKDTEYYGLLNTYTKLILACVGGALFVVDTICQLVYMGRHIWNPIPMAIFHSAWKEFLLRRLVFGLAYFACLAGAIVLAGVMIVSALTQVTSDYGGLGYSRPPGNLTSEVCDCSLIHDIPMPFSFYLEIVTVALSALLLLGSGLSVLTYNGPGCPKYVERLRVFYSKGLIDKFPMIRLPAVSLLMTTASTLLEDVISTVAIVDSEEDVEKAEVCVTTSHYEWLWISKLKTIQIRFLREFFFASDVHEKEECKDVILFAPVLSPRFFRALCSCCCKKDDESYEESKEEEEEASSSSDSDSPSNSDDAELQDVVVQEHNAPESESDPIQKLKPRESSCSCCGVLTSLVWFGYLEVLALIGYVCFAFLVVVPPIVGGEDTVSSSTIESANRTFIKPGLAVVAIGAIVIDIILRLIYVRGNVTDPLRMSLAWSQFDEWLPRRIAFIVIDSSLFVASLIITLWSLFTLYVGMAVTTPTGAEMIYMQASDLRASDDFCGPAVPLMECECVQHCVFKDYDVKVWEILLAALSSLMACVSILRAVITLYTYDSPSSIAYLRDVNRYSEQGLLDRFPQLNFPIYKILYCQPDAVVAGVMRTIQCIQKVDEIKLAIESPTTSHLDFGWIQEMTQEELEFLRWFFHRTREENEERKDVVMYSPPLSRRCFALCCKCCEL